MITGRLVRHNRWLLLAGAFLCSSFVLVVYDEIRTPPYIRYVERTGRPTSVAALRTDDLPVDKADNAAPLLIEARRVFRTTGNLAVHHKLQGLSKTDPHETLQEPILQALEEYVFLFADVITMIHEAARRPSFRYTTLSFDEDAYSEFEVGLDSWRHSIDFSELLLYTGIYALFMEDQDRLQQCIETALLLPPLLAQEPMRVFLDDAVRHANSALILLERTLTRVSLTPATLAEYQAILDAPYYDSMEPVKRTQEYTVAVHLDYIRMFDHSAEYHPTNFLAFSDEFLLRTSDLDQLLMPVWYVMKSDETAVLESFDQTTVTPTARLTGYHYRMMGLRYSSPPDPIIHLQRIAKNRAALTAVAAARYRFDHGRLPDMIEDLVPDYLYAVPRDPFTPDGTICYRIREDHAVFYSLGPNEQDNGGTEAEGGLQHEGDIIFRLPLFETSQGPGDDHEAVSEDRTPIRSPPVECASHACAFPFLSGTTRANTSEAQIVIPTNVKAATWLPNTQACLSVTQYHDKEFLL